MSLEILCILFTYTHLYIIQINFVNIHRLVKKKLQIRNTTRSKILQGFQKNFIIFDECTQNFVGNETAILLFKNNEYIQFLFCG